MQTVNPFNKNANGDIKNLDEIMTELLAQRAKWVQSGSV